MFLLSQTQDSYKFSFIKKKAKICVLGRVCYNITKSTNKCQIQSNGMQPFQISVWGFGCHG